MLLLWLCLRQVQRLLFSISQLPRNCLNSIATEEVADECARECVYVRGAPESDRDRTVLYYMQFNVLQWDWLYMLYIDRKLACSVNCRAEVRSEFSADWKTTICYQRCHENMSTVALVPRKHLIRHVSECTHDRVTGLSMDSRVGWGNDFV